LLLKSGGGFTLIELLVVIATISLLSSIVFASLNSTRAKARDAKRISDIKQLQLALELYHADTGTYPASSMGGFTWALGSCDTGSNYFTNLAPLVSGGYISALPVDPINNRTTVTPRQCYWYGTYGHSVDNCGTINADLYEYVLFFSVENSSYNFPIGRAGASGPSYCFLGPLR